jgi:hypothetical protein
VPISLDDFKKTIGPLAEQLSEKQIEWLFEAEIKIADAIFEWWLRRRNESKLPVDPLREPENNQVTS